MYYLINECLKIIIKKKELDCYERRLGFSENDRFCSISRRRFRMRSRNFPMLEMLQYTRLLERGNY